MIASATHLTQIKAGRPPQRYRAVATRGSLRHLLFWLTWRDLRARYRRLPLGILWALLQPAVATLLLLLVKPLGLPSAPGGLPLPLLLLSGFSLWFFFSNSIAYASYSLIQNRYLLTRHYLPYLLLPFSIVLSRLVDFAFCLALVMGAGLHYGYAASWKLLWLPVDILALAFVAFGLGAGLAALTLRIRSTSAVLPYVMQLGLFASPVLYAIADLPDRWRLAFALNPFAGWLEIFRWSLWEASAPRLPVFTSCAAGLLLASLSILVFQYTEHYLSDRL